MYRITKRFNDYPFAHRQPSHDGHCKLIHGHNWDFEICLEASQLDENGFVYDFGKFGWLKSQFDAMFDHTLVLNQDDPHLEYIRRVLGDQQSGQREIFQFANIVTVPSCSCEGLAEFVYNLLSETIEADTDGRVRVQYVKVYEDRKNTAIYTNENRTPEE